MSLVNFPWEQEITWYIKVCLSRTFTQGNTCNVSKPSLSCSDSSLRSFFQVESKAEAKDREIFYLFPLKYAGGVFPQVSTQILLLSSARS